MKVARIMPDITLEFIQRSIFTRLTALETAAPAQPAPQVAALAAQVQALTTRLTALETTLKAAAKA